MRVSTMIYDNAASAVNILPVLSVSVVYAEFDPETRTGYGPRRLAIEFGWLSYGIVIFFKP